MGIRATRALGWASLFGLAAIGCGSESAARPGTSGANGADAKVISVTAQQWEYSPSEIKLKKGVPVVLEITSLDVHHGFNLSQFNVRADAVPGTKSRVEFTPDKAGTFTFHCDFFCGDGHEDMQGEVIVE
jgi:cytochrome c oxidase subunit 2